MELNRLLFPAPNPNYTWEDFEEELIWVPNLNKPMAPSIPCLLLQPEEGSSKLILYFHANAEDLSQAFEMMDMLRTFIKVHVMGVEYPGYGAYSGKPSARQIIEDAESVYEFIIHTLGFDEKSIMVFGRSMGSGPATYLARYKNPGVLMLMSAYTSIKEAVKNIAGRFWKSFVAERFRNIDNIREIYCPVFIVHGLEDKLIPYEHSQILHENCPGPCELYLPKDMDHNFFEYYEDLLVPFAQFLEGCGIPVHPLVGIQNFIEVPEVFLKPPSWEKKSKNKGTIHSFLKKLNK